MKKAVRGGGGRRPKHIRGKEENNILRMEEGDEGGWEVGKEQMMDVKGSGGMERREIKEGRRGAVSGGFRGH